MENDKLASAVRIALSKLIKRLKKQMHAVDSLSMSEMDTLSFLFNSDKPLSPSELAERNKIKGQSMSEVLIHLKELNMINKVQSSTDKRKFDVSITDHGKHIIEQTRYERDVWLSSAIAHTLSAKEKGTLEEVIPVLEKLSDFQ